MDFFKALNPLANNSGNEENKDQENSFLDQENIYLRVKRTKACVDQGSESKEDLDDFFKLDKNVLSSAEKILVSQESYQKQQEGKEFKLFIDNGISMSMMKQSKDKFSNINLDEDKKVLNQFVQILCNKVPSQINDFVVRIIDLDKNRTPKKKTPVLLNREYFENSSMQGMVGLEGTPRTKTGTTCNTNG